MATITVAEALARIDTYRRRIEAKQQLVDAYLFRTAAQRDPLAAEGGTAAALAAELASLDALQERTILLRRLIQHSYETTPITFGERTRSLADWLVWRREVATRRANFLEALSRRIQRARKLAARRAAGVSEVGAGKAADVVVHLNEQELAGQAEEVEELRGYLQGQLALKNATLTVDVPDAEVPVTALEERLEQRQRQRVSGPPAPGLVLPWSISPELCRLARDPVMKIAAIKLYRQLVNVGLKEAKDAVEAFAAAQD
jgi:hypothetical protein